jgi:hypothetical protein
MCLGSKGLKGSELDKLPNLESDDAFAEHIESEHNIPVRRNRETKEQCEQRFQKAHPESQDPKTCKCPGCKAKRGDVRDAMILELRGGMK